MNFSTLYLFLCIVFVGKGDDQWNRRSKEIIDRDMEILKESKEIESDTWVQDQNFDIATQDNQNNARYKYTKLRKFYRESLKGVKSKRIDKVRSQQRTNGVYTSESAKNVSSEFSLGHFKLFDSNDNQSIQIEETIPKWPKFEDLLLSVGVEYDWKSDRWIKIKDKVTKISDAEINFFNKHKEISHKHDFRYRTVRLNGSKSRKNVIIAVTAVR